MVRTLTLLGLLLWMAHQAPGSNQQVVPPRITTDPVEFARGQVVTFSATFQQRPITCPAGKGPPTKRFWIKIYDDYAVPTEPVWVDYANQTKSRAGTTSTVGPDDADAGKMVTRTFHPINIQEDQTARIYVVLWHACATKRHRNGDLPSPGDDPVIAERYGGRFYRYSCPGTGKIPTGRCAYRPE